MTDLVIITILGAAPDDETWLGLKPFLESIQSTVTGRVDIRSSHHDNRDQLREVASNTREGKRCIVIGHSFGADEAVYLVGGEHGPVAPIQNLILLDRKPQHNIGNWIQMDHWEFAMPTGVDHVANFHGHFGGTMVLPDQPVLGMYSSEMPLYVGHAEFPGHPIVQQFILTQIQARLRETL